MTISGVGGSASGYASQMLMSLLAKMSSTQNVSSDASSTTMQGSEFPSQSFGTGGVQNALQGPTKPSISEGIMQMLLSLQEDSSTAPVNSSTQNPLSQLFSAMDSDGNGAVSQSEMESYVQGQGGTADQADLLFTALDTSGSGSVNQDQMAETLKKSHPHGPPPGPPPGEPPSSSDMASNIVSALDTDGDGSVNEIELDSFVTTNGGTRDQADSVFAALNTSGTGSISQSDFAAALEKLRQNPWGDATAVSTIASTNITA